MKKKFFAIAFAAALMFTANESFAQLKLPAASSAQTITQGLGIENVTLNYSRPSMNGRKIFGELVPYNEVWRTGANTNTTLTFEGDVSLNGHKLTAEPMHYLPFLIRTNGLLLLARIPSNGGLHLQSI
nr:DUF2911 domain-containing protein [Sphingobacterium sp. E70]